MGGYDVHPVTRQWKSACEVGLSPRHFHLVIDEGERCLEISGLLWHANRHRYMHVLSPVSMIASAVDRLDGELYVSPACRSFHT